MEPFPHVPWIFQSTGNSLRCSRTCHRDPDRELDIVYIRDLDCLRRRLTKPLLKNAKEHFQVASVVRKALAKARVKNKTECKAGCTNTCIKAYSSHRTIRTWVRIDRVCKSFIIDRWMLPIIFSCFLLGFFI